ncbi:MAG TPA: Ig-like domain-containing protein [Gemmatimonadales bacterium]|nr:Ig-like domain-containing protein [Gemmatimonadales bacterium]
MRRPVACLLIPLQGIGAALALGCGGSDLTLPSDSQPAALAVVAGNNQTAKAGQAVPEPLVVQATDPAKRPVGQVRVAFVVTAGGGATAPDTAVTDADGRASSRWTLGMAPGAQGVEARIVGSDPVRATFTGTASSTPTGPAATTTQITSVSPSPSFPTQAVVVGFRVTSTGGTPTGTVTVGDGTVSCTGTAPAGQCSLALPTAGTTTLTARYAGTATFGSSSATAPHEVVVAGTQTALSSSANPSAHDQSVTFTASVTSPFRTPNGSIQFVEGSCATPTRTWGMGNLDAAGRASFSTQALSGGTHPMLACYLGNSTFAPSASAILEQEVTKKGRG